MPHPVLSCSYRYEISDIHHLVVANKIILIILKFLGHGDWRTILINSSFLINLRLITLK